MWSSILVPAVLVVACPRQTFSYNTNRHVVLLKDNNCGYYDNPVFQVRPTFIQNRMKETHPSPQYVLIDNRLRKEAPYYQNMYQKSPPVQEPKYQRNVPASYFPNMTPLNLANFHRAELERHSPEEEAEEEDEDEIKIDYDKLWKVGESPASKTVQALPDVYVKPGDAPPIVDMLSMERSELTEETHDLENVEIQEKYLSEPRSKTKEVIIERVDTRPEPPSTANPVLAMFKEIDIPKAKNEKKVVKMKKQKEMSNAGVATTVTPDDSN